MTGPYDRIGHGYAGTRQPDPRLAAQVQAALRGAATVVNVGAGTGSYEGPGVVLAVEPSAVMVAQRPAGAAPCVRAVAEALPLRDGAVEAATALLTVHHWTDPRRGLAELRRVARRTVVVLTWDQPVARDGWLVREYLPALAALDDTRALAPERVAALLGGGRVEVVPVPHDCVDGFGSAFWRRPEAYLDPRVRAGMSMFAQADPAVVEAGLARLADDLARGAWHRRHADLLEQDSLDCGYRLVVAER